VIDFPQPRIDFLDSICTACIPASIRMALIFAHGAPTTLIVKIGVSPGLWYRLLHTAAAARASRPRGPATRPLAPLRCPRPTALRRPERPSWTRRPPPLRRRHSPRSRLRRRPRWTRASWPAARPTPRTTRHRPCSLKSTIGWTPDHQVKR